MLYMKHHELGNAHVADAEQAQREADGWVRWPRTKAQKVNAAPQDKQECVVSPGSTPAPDGAAPARKKPGPKPKV